MIGPRLVYLVEGLLPPLSIEDLMTYREILDTLTPAATRLLRDLYVFKDYDGSLSTEAAKVELETYNLVTNYWAPGGWKGDVTTLTNKGNGVAKRL